MDTTRDAYLTSAYYVFSGSCQIVDHDVRETPVPKLDVFSANYDSDSDSKSKALLGSRLSIFALFASPSKTNSLINFPVAQLF